MNIHTYREGDVTGFWDDTFEKAVRKEMVRQVQEEPECIFCSVRMFGTDAYTGDNGETVHVDFIKPENREEYCRAHCNIAKQKYENRINRVIREITRNRKKIKVGDVIKL